MRAAGLQVGRLHGRLRKQQGNQDDSFDSPAVFLLHPIAAWHFLRKMGDGIRIVSWGVDLRDVAVAVAVMIVFAWRIGLQGLWWSVAHGNHSFI